MEIKTGGRTNTVRAIQFLCPEFIDAWVAIEKLRLMTMIPFRHKIIISTLQVKVRLGGSSTSEPTPLAPLRKARAALLNANAAAGHAFRLGSYDC
jgi:hypothetical protein